MKKLVFTLMIITVAVTHAQVTQVRDIYPGITSGLFPTGFTGLTNSIVLNGKLLFVARGTVGRVQLWKSDGTSAGTLPLGLPNSVGDANPTGFATYTTTTGTKAFFSANNGANSNFGSNYELWQADGTTTGTIMTSEINTATTSSPGSFPSLLTVFGNSLYFKAIGGAFLGEELFVTDGTAVGTGYVKNINPTNGGDSAPRSLTVANNKLFFTANNGTTGRELYVTTGPLAANISSIDICPGVLASSPQNLTAFNDKVYFSALNCSSGITGIWKSDGTVGGTSMIANVDSSGNANPQDFIVSQGLLFFTANTSTAGREIHYVDTNDQESVYRSINPGTADAMSTGNQYIEYNNVLYFLANNGTSGNELWRIDRSISGTADTAMVKDINVTGSSNPSNFIVFGGKLIFQANDGIHGAELWQTDGTEAGTVLVADINPGSGSSSPSDFAVLNNNELLFTANDGLTGSELWKINAATLSNHNLAMPISNSIKLYPNPSKAYFELTTNQVIEKVEIYSMLGQLVKTFPVQNQYETSDLSKGTYIVKINVNNVYENKKLVVE